MGKAAFRVDSNEMAYGWSFGSQKEKPAVRLSPKQRICRAGGIIMVVVFGIQKACVKSVKVWGTDIASNGSRMEFKGQSRTYEVQLFATYTGMMMRFLFHLKNLRRWWLWLDTPLGASH